MKPDYPPTPIRGAEQHACPKPAPGEAEILLEIQNLKVQLSRRRQAERPPSLSVVRAYQSAIQKHYERLDGLKQQQSTLLP